MNDAQRLRGCARHPSSKRLQLTKTNVRLKQYTRINNRSPLSASEGRDTQPDMTNRVDGPTPTRAVITTQHNDRHVGRVNPSVAGPDIVGPS